MPRTRNITAVIVNVAVFMIMEAASLYLVCHDGTIQNLLITRAAHSFKAWVWGSGERIGQYFSLRAENDRLSEENFALRAELERLGGEREKERMDSIVLATHGKTIAGGFAYKSASIIKMSTNTQHNYLIINAGSEDGVRRGDGIITAHGTIGIIDAVARHHSYARSFLNSDISVSARLGNEGALGPLSWDGKGSRRAILKEIPLQYKFEQGDTVFTSGFSTIFPSDIPLGVTGDAKIVNGSTYEIEVELFQDFKRLKYVTVASNLGQEEISMLEKENRGK